MRNQFTWLFAGTVFLAGAISIAQNQTPALLTYAGATSGAAHSQVELAAVAKDNPSGKLVQGGHFEFKLGTASCTADTDAKGRAACKVALDQPPGKYKVEVEFQGSRSMSAGPASIEQDFTITAAKASRKKS